jgi:hypothetical protein
MSFNSRIRRRSEAYLPENNQITKRLLGVIICGRHAGNSQEGKKMLLLGTGQEATEIFSGLEGNRPLADAVQLFYELRFDGRRIVPGELTCFQFLTYVAGTGAEVRDLIAEDRDAAVLFPNRQQRMFRADRFGIGDDMGQAGLPIAADPVTSIILIVAASFNGVKRNNCQQKAQEGRGIESPRPFRFIGVLIICSA